MPRKKFTEQSPSLHASWCWGSRRNLLPESAASWVSMVAQSCLTLCDCMDYTELPMEYSRPEYWSGQPFPSPGDLPNSGIKPRSPSLQVDSLPVEPQGKPKNTGVGSLALLQGIFPTQGSNPRLLRCRRILYQPSTFRKVLRPWFGLVPEGRGCEALGESGSETTLPSRLAGFA